MNSITKSTFKGMDTDSKLAVLFDYAQDTHHAIQKFESRKRVDKALAITGGIIGGFLAMAGKWVIGK